MAVEEKITEEQAEAALHQLATGVQDEEEVAPQEAQAGPEPSVDESGAPEATPTEEVEPGAVVEPEAPPAEPVEAAPVPDVQGIEKRYNEQLEAVQLRNAENARIQSDRYLRKSTAGDKLAQLLEAAQTDAGVSPDDARRVLAEYRGTLNPASAGYEAPASVAPPPPQAAVEDQLMTANAFLNEKSMTQDEAGEFKTWIQTESTKVMSPAEQAVSHQSLDGFLRLAHHHWQSGLKAQEAQTKRDNTVGAVRSVQATQRAAAKAAAPRATAPRTQPAGPAQTVDVKKLTPDDIGALLRQSVEQYS